MSVPTDAQPPRPPNPHKLVLLTWVGIYPTIAFVLWLLLPTLLEHCALPVITMIVTAIVVPLMSYVVMPVPIKAFGD
ncbi:MAG: hypothetical protein ACE37K_22395 [Planctomycetota bacterium]